MHKPLRVGDTLGAQSKQRHFHESAQTQGSEIKHSKHAGSMHYMPCNCKTSEVDDQTGHWRARSHKALR